MDKTVMIFVTFSTLLFLSGQLCHARIHTVTFIDDDALDAYNKGYDSSSSEEKTMDPDQYNEPEDEGTSSVHKTEKNPSPDSRSLCETLGLENPISDLVYKIIKEIQSHMHDGIPSMGIPPLDPLNITKYDFDTAEPSFNLDGEVKNVIVTNLSTFNVTNVSTKFLKREVNVSIEIPNLFIQGKYAMKGKALSFIPINGHGPFTLKPIGTRATVMSQLTYSGGHFVLQSFDYKVTISDVHVDFEGIYESGIASKILNGILNEFGTSLFSKLEPLVHEDIRKELEEDIDRILKDIKFTDYVHAALSAC